MMQPNQGQSPGPSMGITNPLYPGPFGGLGGTNQQYPGQCWGIGNNDQQYASKFRGMTGPSTSPQQQIPRDIQSAKQDTLTCSLEDLEQIDWQLQQDQTINN